MPSPSQALCIYEKLQRLEPAEYTRLIHIERLKLYLPMNDIDRSKIKVRSPKTNSICERSHKTILQKFCHVVLRKNVYDDLAALQNELDNC